MVPSVIMAGEEKSTKKKRDPIFSVCFVIFVVAAVAVLGSFVYSEYIQEDTTRVAYGDKVVVDYTGSYYDYYDKEDAVIFDTSFRSIGESADYKKANDFSKTSYSTFDVTVGSGKALKMFEESLVGHKVGDEVRVHIPAGEGYNSGNTAVKTLSAYSVPLTQEYTLTQFKNLYPDISLTAGVSKDFTTVYGWAAIAVLDGSNTVNVTNSTTLENEYDYGKDTGLKEKNVAYDSASKTINFTFALDESKITKVGEQTADNVQTIQMIKVDFGGIDSYITSYNTSTGDIYYKQTDEKNDIDLYFVIKIVSIGS